MIALIELFCDIDDFLKQFLPQWEKSLIETETVKRHRPFMMSPAEVMVIVLWFHRSHYRNFKHYYLNYVSTVLAEYFPKRVSYNRFIELQHSLLIPFCAYLQTRKVTSEGIAFVDSTAIRVCHNKRIYQHRVFKGAAQRGKTSVDWFYGFKLHLIINDRGELINLFVTAGNVDDRKALQSMLRGLKGKVFGDKGYLSKLLKETLFEQGVELITRVRKNMKPVKLSEFDNMLLHKRSLIETVYDQLKNISQVEHSRHRSIVGFFINLLASVISYTWQPKKPSLDLRQASSHCKHL